MTSILATSRGRLATTAVVFATFLILILIWFRTAGDLRGEVVGDSPSQEAWNTVEYDGVRVDIPSAWERLDTGDCEFKSERWARPGSPPCEFEEGVAFYGSATFDPNRGPGVKRTTESGSPTWDGYTYAGNYAVYASYADRAIVDHVLNSAEAAG